MNNQGINPTHHILTGQTERIASVNPAVAVRILAKLSVMVTFALLLAGALITSNKAALANPTWPAFAGGHWIPQFFVGGLVYTETHRIIVLLTFLLTLVLAFSIQIKEKRSSVKKLGWAAVALIIGQALFGGLIITTVQNPFVSIAHAAVAHLFFGVMVTLAVMTSRSWFRDMASPTVDRLENSGYLKSIRFVVILLFIQIIAGAGVRHSNAAAHLFIPHLMTHIAGAFAVIFGITWFNLRTWHVYRDVAFLRNTAIWSGVLVGFQILFGILSFFANRARLHDGMPELHHVITSTSHLAGGAVLFALMVGTLVRASHFLEISPAAVQAQHSREVNQ